jgi:hypothetical protein
MLGEGYVEISDGVKNTPAYYPMAAMMTDAKSFLKCFEQQRKKV